jgi:hypothetical protein
MSQVGNRPCTQRALPHASQAFTGAGSAGVGAAASGADVAGTSVSFGFGVPQRSADPKLRVLEFQMLFALLGLI